MLDGAIEELLKTIDEQSEIIMKQADRINELSAALLQHCAVLLEETGGEEKE